MNSKTLRRQNKHIQESAKDIGYKIRSTSENVEVNLWNYILESKHWYTVDYKFKTNNSTGYIEVCMWQDNGHDANEEKEWSRPIASLRSAAQVSMFVTAMLLLNKVRARQPRKHQVE